MIKNLPMMIFIVVLWHGVGMKMVNAGLTQPTLSNNGINWDANFGNNAVVGPFNDAFDLALPTNGFGIGASLISGFNGGFNVKITALSFVNTTTSTILAKVTADNVSTFGYVGFLDAAHNYQILVSGDLSGIRESGSYSGNIQITPMPEPEVYVMMLIGLGLVGLTLRQRKLQV